MSSVRLSVSVAELLPATGSVTPPGAATGAVLLSVPVAAADTVPVAVNVAVPPGSSVTVVVDVAAAARGAGGAGRWPRRSR